MLQCWRRTGHLPSFCVPTPGDLTGKESPPSGICHPASSPVARDHWGVFKLIIKESGDEGSDGKGRKSEAKLSPLSPFPSHHSPLALYARSHHPSLALLACSRARQSSLSLGKACGGGRFAIQGKKKMLMPGVSRGGGGSWTRVQLTDA